MGSTIYLEILVLIDILLRDVLRDHLVGDIPRTTAKVPTCPQMPPPELFLQMREFCQQVVGCLPFQPLQQSADRYLRRDRNKQVDLGPSDVPLPDVDLLLCANNPNQVRHSRGHPSAQYRAP